MEANRAKVRLRDIIREIDGIRAATKNVVQSKPTPLETAVRQLLDAEGDEAK